jgi:hypothetical protein
VCPRGPCFSRPVSPFCRYHGCMRRPPPELFHRPLYYPGPRVIHSWAEGVDEGVEGLNKREATHAVLRQSGRGRWMLRFTTVHGLSVWCALVVAPSRSASAVCSPGCSAAVMLRGGGGWWQRCRRESSRRESSRLRRARMALRSIRRIDHGIGMGPANQSPQPTFLIITTAYIPHYHHLMAAGC